MGFEHLRRDSGKLQNAWVSSNLLNQGVGRMGFVRAARKDEIPAGSIREFQVDGLTVAIANMGNKFYAINNTCLHRGGPLGQGNSKGSP